MGVRAPAFCSGYLLCGPQSFQLHQADKAPPRRAETGAETEPLRDRFSWPEAERKGEHGGHHSFPGAAALGRHLLRLHRCQPFMLFSYAFFVCFHTILGSREEERVVLFWLKKQKQNKKKLDTGRTVCSLIHKGISEDLWESPNLSLAFSQFPSLLERSPSRGRGMKWNK